MVFFISYDTSALSIVKVCSLTKGRAMLGLRDSKEADMATSISSFTVVELIGGKEKKCHDSKEELGNEGISLITSI